MHRLLIIALLALAACTEVPAPTAPPQNPANAAPPTPVSASAARQFVDVVKAVEPFAERECRARTSGVSCDFSIQVFDDPGKPANAFQTVDRSGRPVLAFNHAMLQSVRNADELAFVLGHEASHHILGHLDQTQESALVGAVVFSGLAAINGASPEQIREAQEVGALAGARAYSKEFELQADQLGTLIAHRAGYDPVRGAQFFNRLPDPGNRFLGSHPPNAARLAIVKKTAAGL